MNSVEATAPVVLFRVAAGPRMGFGHLVRAVSLARVFGIRPLVSLRGGQEARRVVRRLSGRLVDGPASCALDRVRPSVLVLDEPRSFTVSPWVIAARNRGVMVVSIVDGDIGSRSADLVVDGNVCPGEARTGITLRGPRYMILDPQYRRRARGVRRMRPLRILVALGGGRHAGWASKLVGRLEEACPGTSVRSTAGCSTGRLQSQASLLAEADLAVTAGGVSAYEACASGVATVAVAVVPDQRRTVSGLAGRGAVLDGGSLLCSRTGRSDAAAEQCVRAIQQLASHRTERQALSRRALRVVDGRGGERVARRIVELLAEHERAQAVA